MEAKTQTIAEAAKELGIGKNQAYAAAQRGELPVIRIGKRILVLREPFKRMLGGESA
jgi:excisionase family DNA binding protein